MCYPRSVTSAYGVTNPRNVRTSTKKKSVPARTRDIAARQESGAFVAGVALEHGLNDNLFRPPVPLYIMHISCFFDLLFSPENSEER